MKFGFVFLALTLAGCECGPGIACKDNAPCGTWGHCELLGASAGYCVANPSGGTPKALVSVDKLDFPAVPCGTTVTLQIDVFNSGGGQLTFSGSTGTSTFFSVTGGDSVDGGAHGTLVVSAIAPGTAVAGAEQAGTLTLTTNDPSKPKIDVPLTLKTSGVTLTLMPGSATFGSFPVNSPAADVPLTLTNSGNVPATLMFAQPLDDQFTVGWTGSPAAVTVVPGMSANGLVARFTPHRIMPSTTTASISVAEAICGSSVSKIPMSGGGIGGALTVSAAELTFGDGGQVDCGATAAAQKVTLQNTGNASLNWTGSLAKSPSSPFTVSLADGGAAQSGLLVMGATTELTITPASIPAGASTTPEGFADTLTLLTDVPNDSSHLVNLHQTARGAVLSFAPGAIDFGTVPLKTIANAPFKVVNAGNAPANVALVSSSDKFSVSPGGPAGVDGGVALSVTAFFAPDAGFEADGGVRREDGTVSMSAAVGDVLCAPLPAPLTLTGVGTTGSVSYSPAALSFGSVDCGKTGSAKQVTFTNSGTLAYQIVSATLGRDVDGGSPYTVALSPASGLAASDGGSVVITVTPRPIPSISEVTANLYGDTLTVTTDVSGDSPHTLALDETARGAIFGVSTNAMNFGSVPTGGLGTSLFTLSNSGNADGTISITVGQPTIFQLPLNALVAANSLSMQIAHFSPQAAALYTDTGAISVSTSTVLCKPLPFLTIGLTGQGSSSNVVMVSATDLTFGQVKCGTTAAAKTLTVTNNSNQTLTFSLSLGGGSTYFSVTGPATLAPTASGMITVTPKPIPTAASIAADAFGDTLSIRGVGAPVDETHVVGLHQTAQGAILSFNPAGIDFGGGSGTQNFTVNNVGNLTASITLSNPGSPFSVTPSSATVVGPGNTSGTANYSQPFLNLGANHNASVSLGTTTTLCAPLPSALTLHGN